METVLITGAARRVGAHLAAELAADGCFVWIHYRTHEAEAFTLRNQIKAKGGMAECIQCDLTKIIDIDRMLDTISESFGSGLTTLINNASFFLNKTIQETSSSEWDSVINTNLKAIWYLSVKFAGKFPSAKRIISVGDANIANAMQQHAIYALSKNALKFLNEQIAAAFAPSIYVNLLSPGLIMKGENEPEMIWKQRQERSLTDNSDILNHITEGIRFLMNDPGMTGSELIIDNGIHLYGKTRIMK